MKYQPKGSPLCGPTSIQNALRFYRKKVGLKKILAGMSKDVLVEGAHQFELLAGLHELGFHGKCFNVNARETARTYLKRGTPTILCVHTDNPWDHWVCVLHLHQLDSYLLLDSENSKKNIAENGSHVLSWRQLQNLWMAPAAAQIDRTDRTYYGIQVVPFSSTTPFTRTY